MLLTNEDMNQKTKALLRLPTSPQNKENPELVMKSSESITPTLSSVLSNSKTVVSSKKIQLQMKNRSACLQCETQNQIKITPCLQL
jgi:hypothetical protein